MTGMTIELSEYVIDAIADAVVKKMQEPILDKIRAEIDSHCSDNRDRNDGLYIAMKIIDRYIAIKEGDEQ